MKEHNVDFIGGDIKMSALSTVGDVFSDPEFSAPSNSFLWGLGALEEPNRECIGFFIMLKRPYEWRVDSHGCYKFDNPRSNLSLSCVPPSPHLDPAASCAVSKRNKEGLSADIANTSVCGDDALECENCSSKSCQCPLFSFLAVRL